MLGIAASDIRVHTGEPHLAQRLGAGGSGLRRLDPEGRRKIGPPLVQGERVKGIFDMRAQRRVVKLVELGENLVEMARDPELSDRVPHTDAFYRDIPVPKREIREHVGLSRLIF